MLIKYITCIHINVMYKKIYIINPFATEFFGLVVIIFCVNFKDITFHCIYNCLIKGSNGS